MAEIVFPCHCGMLLKVYGDDQVGHGIVCPACGSTVIVPAEGVAVDNTALLVPDGPLSVQTAATAGKWFGLVYLAGISIVTLGLIKFILMPALAPPVTVAQVHAFKGDDEPDDAPRRLLKQPRGRAAHESIEPAVVAPKKVTARPGSRVDSSVRRPVPRKGRGGAPRSTVPLRPAPDDSEIGPATGADGRFGESPTTPADGIAAADETPDRRESAAPTKPSERRNGLGPGPGGPARARRLSKNEIRKPKPSAKLAAKPAEKPQDPVARVKTLMNLAYNLEYQQNYDAALEYYREIATKYPDAPQAKKATERIRALTAK